MAQDRKVNIIIRADDQASGKIRHVSEEVTGLKAPLGVAGAGLSSFGASLAAVGGVAALLGIKKLGQDLVGGILSAAQAAGEQQLATAKLANAIASTGVDVDEAVPRFSRFAAEMQKQTGIGDEVIASNAAVLASLGGLTGEGLERTTKAALDLGAAIHNPEGAFLLLAKAAGGSSEMLGRYGIKVDETLSPQKKFEQALTIIETKLHGSAAAALNTYIGRIAAFKAAVGDLKEAVGGPFSEVFELFLKDVLTPLVERMTGATNSSRTFRDAILDLAIGATKVILPLARVADMINEIAIRGDNPFFAAMRRDFIIGASVASLVDNNVKQLIDTFKKLETDRRDSKGLFTPGAVRDIERAKVSTDSLAGSVEAFLTDLELARSGSAKTATGVKGLGRTAEDTADQFKDLNAALSALKLPEFKGDAGTQVNQIAVALEQLDRIRPTIHTEEALKQIDALRFSLLRLREESTDIEVSAKVVGLPTLAELQSKVHDVESAIASVNELELIGGPQTETAISQTERIKEAIEKNIVDLLKQNQGLKFAGIEGPAFQKLQIRAEVEDLASKPLENIAAYGPRIKAALKSALDLRDSSGVFDAALDANIKKLFELNDAALQIGNALKQFGLVDIGFGITLPDLGKVKEAFDLIAGIESAYHQSRIDLGIATSDEILQQTIDEINARADARSKEVETEIADETEKQVLLKQIRDTAANERAAATQAEEDRIRNIKQNAAISLFGALAQVAAVAGQRNKAAFRASQAFAIVEATISTYQAANNALATKAPWPIPLVFAAAAIAAGIANVAAIASQKPPSNFASGGIAQGPDTGRDTIQAMVRGGELMVPPDVAREVFTAARSVGVNTFTGPGGVGLTREFREFLTADRGPVAAFAVGGIAPGVDTGRDTIPALVRGGELMIPPDTARGVIAAARAVGITNITGPGGKGLTREFREFLTSDRGPNVPPIARFATGGIVDTPTPTPVQVVTRGTTDLIVRSVVGFDGPVHVTLSAEGDVLQRIVGELNARVERGSLRVKASDFVSSRSGR